MGFHASIAQSGKEPKVPISGMLHIAYHVGDQPKDFYSPTFDIENDELKVSYTPRDVDTSTTLFLTISTKKDITLDNFEITLTEDLKEATGVFCNGFQSWTTSQEYDLNEKIPHMGAVGKAFAGHYGDYIFFKSSGTKGKLHSWTYTYVRTKNGQIRLVGSIHEYSGYTWFLHNNKDSTLTIGKDCQGLQLKANIKYDGMRLFMAEGDEEKVFDKYTKHFSENLNRIAIKNGMQPHESTAKPAIGWTSWYNYYNKISEDTILANLRNFKAKKIAINMFQIDDGYQLSTGDWLHTNAHFPRGMKPIADSVHAAGYKAGIWLAPFICERKSFMVQQHPDWLLKGKNGKAIVVGINPMWSGKYYALDIYNKDVRAYLKTVFDTVLRKWNYDMVKLDFLFAAALYPPKEKTRGEVMMDGMLLLRELVGPDKYIDGCGAPIGPAFKLTDYCRVSSDIHTHWEQKILKALKARERLSVWNSLTTVIGRQQLAGRMFLSDPDVYILRKENQHLTTEQQHTMLLVDNLFGKLVLMSDNISRYDSTQMADYLSAFPYVDKQHLEVKVVEKDFYSVYFEIDKRKYLSIINLSSKPKQYPVDMDAYYDGVRVSKYDTKAGVSTRVWQIAPYQSFCTYLMTAKPFEVVGGGGSLFPGSEVEDLQLVNANSITVKFRQGYQQQGTLVIKVPTEFMQMNVNGKTVKAVDMNGIHCLLYKR